MSRFVLTAQIALQAPSNTQQVVNQIRRQLQGVSVNINVNANTRQLAQANNQLNSVTRSSTEASRSVSELGRTLGAAARRFGAISIATGTFLALTRSIKNSLGDAIEFERQMVILSQTTGKTVRQLGGLYNEINRLSTSLGVSSDGLVKTAIVLAQAGLEARKTKAALEVLAKTQLAASFDNIVDTTEGAIAILSQFRNEAIQAGGDIKFLEQSLEAINQVSKRFAVESSDLIAVIRRSGGAFEAAGGSLNELLALFTSVRATTRESAETISTGLRTIFTRIQRTDTIKALQELGITLQDVEGKFVGPYEAIRRISEGLASLDPRDFRFAAIVEELGGFRQIGKVIPLIKQFTVAQDALNTAQSSSGSLTQDVTTAQQSLANQIARVREEFQALIRKFTDSETFRSVAGGALEFARALIKVADAIEPILPMIAGLAAVQIGRGLVPAVGALAGVGRRNQGGPIRAFATGGLVPGVGNRDTVPAMLSPGEFVIRKSSVNKIGAANLAHMNSGGMVQHFAEGTQGKGVKKKKDLLTSMAENRARVAQKSPAAGKLFSEFDKGLEESLYYGSPKLMKSINKEAAVKDKKKEKEQLKQAKMARLENYRKQIESGQEEISYDEYNPDERFELNNRNKKRNAKRVQNLAGVLSKNNEEMNFGGKIEHFAKGGKKNFIDATATRKAVKEERDKARIAAGEKEFTSATYSPGKELLGSIEAVEKGALIGENTFGAAFLSPENQIKDLKGTVQGSEIFKDVASSPAYQFFDKSKNLDPKVQAGFQKLKTKLQRDRQFEVIAESLSSEMSGKVEDAIFRGVLHSIQSGAALLTKDIGATKAQTPQDAATILRSVNIDNIIGNLYEGILQNAGAPFKGIDKESANATWDFPKGMGDIASNFGDGRLKRVITDAKTRFTTGNITSLITKAKNYEVAINKKRLSNLIAGLEKTRQKGNQPEEYRQTELAKKFNLPKGDIATRLENLGYERTGKKDATQSPLWKYKFQRKAQGGAASDTVPALLTPGEFVVNRKSAQRIGYGALNKMNKTGVAGFAKGGPVGGVMRFNKGTEDQGVPRVKVSQLTATGNDQIWQTVEAKLSKLGVSVEKMGVIFAMATTYLQSGLQPIAALNKAFRDAGVAVAATSRKAGEGNVNSPKILAPEIADKALQSTKENVNAAFSDKSLADATKTINENTKSQKGSIKENKTINKDAKAKAKEKCINLCKEDNATSTVITTNAGTVDDKKEPENKGAKEASQETQNFAASMRNAIQSAQQFIFLGSAISAVSIQFLGLNDSISQAATETIAFAATVAGSLGTFLDFGISLFSLVAPTLSAAIANGSLAASSGIAAAAMAVLTSPVTILVGLFIALAGAAIYFQKAYAKAEAERIQKSNDALAEDIKSGKASIASKEKFVQQEVAASKTLIDSYGIFSGVAEEQKKIQLAATARIASAYMDSIIAVRQFDENMQKIDADKIMTPFQKAGAGILAFADSAAKARASLQTAIAERERMISQQAAKSGVDRSKITEDSFADPDQKRAFKQANETVTNNIDFLSNTFKETTSRFQTQLEESFKNTNFSKATKDMNADGMINAMDAVMEQNAGLAESLAETKRQILLNAEALAANTTDPKAQAEIMHKANMQVYDLGVSSEKQAISAGKAAQSGELLAKAMADTRNSVLIFKDINNFLGRQAKQTEKFTNLLTQSANIMQSELGDFSLPEIPGLADLKDVKDINEFKNKLGGLAGILGTQGKEIEKVLSATAESFQVVEQSLINVPDLAKIQAPGGGLNTVAENAINAALAPLNKLPPSFQAFATGIKASLRSAVESDSPGKGTITEEEARNAYEPLMGAIKSYNEVLSKLVEVASGQLQAYSQHLNQLRSAFQEEINSRQQMVDIMLRGQERMAEALGKSMSIAQKEAARQQKRQIGITAVGGKMKATDVGGIGKALGAAQAQRTVNARQIEDLRTKPSEQNIKKLKLLADEENKLALKTKQYRDVLEDLSDQSERAADVLGEIDKEKAKRETGTKILEDFITGGLSEQSDILKNFTGIQVAAQTGTLQNFDTETKKSVMGLLSQLGSVDEGFENFRKQLIYSDAVMAGLDPQIAQSLANATPKEQQLLQQLQDINLQEMQASEALRQANADNMTELQKNTNTMGQLINELAKNTQAQIAQAQNKIVQTEQQRQQEAARNKQQDILKQQAATNQQRMEQAKRAEAERRSKASLGLASGGLIYAADGAPIFKPKGTDTVPAMLTPGEFVIQKSAVDQYGTGFMEAVNAGTFAKGGVVYAADGSAINKKKKRKQDKNRQVAADFGTLVDPKDPEISLYGSTGGVVYAANGGSTKPELSYFGWQPPGSVAPPTQEAPTTQTPEMVGPPNPNNPFSQPVAPGQPDVPVTITPAPANNLPQPVGMTDEQLAISRMARGRGAAVKQQRIQQELQGKQQRLQERQQKFAQAQQQAAYRRLPRSEKLRLQAAEQQKKQAGQAQTVQNQRMRDQEGAAARQQQYQANQQRVRMMMQQQAQQEARLQQQAQQMEAQRRNQELAEERARNARGENERRQIEAARMPQNQQRRPANANKGKGTIAYAQSQGMAMQVSPAITEKEKEQHRARMQMNNLRQQGTVTQISGPINLEERKRKTQQQEEMNKNVAGVSQTQLNRRGYAKGGIIYASNGASIFKPRGTDTVPAMLTPGEFIMQKSAVDQYGAGFMNSVNNGQAPGYNTGGIVYRQGGGMMDKIAGAAGGAMKAIGIDPNSVQNLTGTLTQTFEKFIGNVPSAFAPIVDGLNNFMNQMANFAGISLDMKVNVDGMLNIGGINTQSIVDAVKNGIGEMVANEVKKQLPDNKDFKTA